MARSRRADEEPEEELEVVPADQADGSTPAPPPGGAPPVSAGYQPQLVPDVHSVLEQAHEAARKVAGEAEGRFGGGYVMTQAMHLIARLIADVIHTLRTRSAREGGPRS